MQSLTWYLNRLGRMSPGELAYRVAQAGRAAADGISIRVASTPPEPRLRAESRIIAPGDSSLSPEPYVEQAARIMQGRFSIFDLDDVEIGTPPRWNRDPLTGRVAPLASAHGLDYRDEQLVGNIKYLWEPNRHLHTPQLAQAYFLTRDSAYADAVRTQIDSWIEQCPCGRGANWTSSLELAIRLINWSLAWQWLGGADSIVFAGSEGQAFRRRWLASVYQQARAITRKLSRYSSANNHLIGEAAGVWIASITWDCWPQMRVWGERCRLILIDELFKQNAEDGGNREQAFAYQQFVLDFFLLAGLAARAAREDFPGEYWGRIERMIDFIASMMDVGGHMPMIGDADDGYVVRLSPEPDFDNFRSLLATGAVLFDRSDLAAKAGALDHKTRWLLGGAAQSRFAQLRQDAPAYRPARAFAQSGYYVLGSDLETADEVKMLVDAGPLGYLSIAAHGHADALSIVLNVDGEEVLIDPGTYAYHTQPEWRRYFRSTRAHNTLVVDRQDQSRQAGNFMWSRHAEARCVEFDVTNEALQRFAGEHEGYGALSDPVLHRREIVYEPGARRFTITDLLSCAAAHDAERCWHFAEMLEPELIDGEIRVQTARRLVRIVPQERPQDVQRFKGGEATEGGWISRRFGRKSPTTSVVWRSRVVGRARLVTHIYV